MPKNESMNMFISILDEVKKEGSKSQTSNKTNNSKLFNEKSERSLNDQITNEDLSREEVKEQTKKNGSTEQWDQNLETIMQKSLGTKPNNSNEMTPP